MRAKELTIFVVCVAAAATVMQASGLGPELGVQPDPGVDLGEVEEEAESVESDRDAQHDTIIDVILATGRQMTTALSLAFALPVMLMNLGLPVWLAVFVSSPVYIVVLYMLAAFLRGVVI